MYKAWKRCFLPALALMLALSGLTGCGKKEKTGLPPVVVVGIPENEKMKSEIKLDGYTLQIYSTYAAVTAYEGDAAELTVPASAAGITVKLIDESAFAQNTKITKVTLPDGLLKIGRYAFQSCTALQEVVCGSKLETIDDYAFQYSTLAVIDLPDTVSTLGKYAFYGTGLTSVKIPANVSRAGKFCFYGCTGLRSVTFCPRLTEISENMFYNCTSLTQIVIPETVTEIGSYAFSTCSSLTAILIPETVTKVGEGCFFDCPALTVYTPAGSAAEKIARRNGYRYEVCDYAAKAADMGQN